MVNIPLKIARAVHILQGQVFFPLKDARAVFALQRLGNIPDNFARILKFQFVIKKAIY